MELETVNKLYLELSQFATATTAKEIALEIKANRMLQAVDQVIVKMDELCDKYDSIGGGHAAQPIRNLRNDLQRALNGDQP